jgi:hypothetical protein
VTTARALAIRIPGNIWSWIRQVSGDAAYENYLRSKYRIADVACAESRTVHAGCRAHTTSAPLLTRREFYLDALRRRYSTISRCC